MSTNEFHWNHLQPYLREWAMDGKIPATLLIKGLKGIGKREVAREIATFVLCEKGPFYSEENSEELSFGFGLADVKSSNEEATQRKNQTAPCGVCNACLQMHENKNVNFTEILREEESDYLKIENFKVLKEKMGYGGFGSAHRIFLIPEADRMTVQSANSILKLFEEPPKGWIFILTSDEVSRIPVTILSRCQSFSLSPLPNDLLKKMILKEVRSEPLKGGSKKDWSSDEISLLVKLSEGSLNRARNFMDLDFVEKLKSLKSIFFQKSTEQCVVLFEWMSAHTEGISLVLDLEEAFMREAVYLEKNLKEKCVFMEHSPEILSKIETVGMETFYAKLERIQECRELLRTNVNLKILSQEVSQLLLF